MLRHLIAVPSGFVIQCSCSSSPFVVVIHTLRASCLNQMPPFRHRATWPHTVQILRSSVCLDLHPDLICLIAFWEAVLHSKSEIAELRNPGVGTYSRIEA